jgi:hypothetical protein
MVMEEGKGGLLYSSTTIAALVTKFWKWPQPYRLEAKNVKTLGLARAQSEIAFTFLYVTIMHH